MSGIDNNFLSMIRLLTNAATGNNIDVENFDEDKVFQYAQEQSVLPLVCSALNADKYKRLILGAVSKNITDLSYVRSILDEMSENNIEYAILKGESIANIYKVPELRISGDIDILVDEKDEANALEIFSKHGYTYTKRPEWGNETALYHQSMKIVEIHVALYDQTRKDLFFGDAGNIRDTYMKITTNNLGEINILSPNDGIMFLYLHFVKHFLSSGAGIRQLLDVVIYSKYYKDKIDWDGFFNRLESIHYLQLYVYILSAAVKYMGFTKEELPDINYDFDRADKLVEDLQHSGIFGCNEAELAVFKRIYEKKRNEKYGLVDYDEFAKCYHYSIPKLIFPPFYTMRKRYEYLNKYPYLLPIAWMQRFVALGLGFLKGNKNIKTYININKVITNKSIDKRMQLMEELDII